MSFYRIYRPQILDELDNLTAREILTSLLKKTKSDLPHAYLFSGPKGIGKTTAARLIAKIFNCTEKVAEKRPCGACDQCTSIAKGTNLDVLEIDAASNRGIDEVRQLRDRIGFTPSQAGFTVYIIDEVHMLTNEAFNALLKTLEEPPPHAVFILATTELEKVPVTVRSRCMVVTFSKATAAEVMHALKRIVKNEKIEIEETAIAQIIEYADGSFRDAVKYLEQLNLVGGKITSELVQDTLRLSSSQNVDEFINFLQTKNQTAALAILEKMSASGADFKQFTIDCLTYLEKELVAAVKAPNDSQIDLVMIKDLLRRLIRAYSEIKISPIVSIPLELVIVEIGENSLTTPVKSVKPVAVMENSVPKVEVKAEVKAEPKVEIKPPQVKAEPVISSPIKNEVETPVTLGLISIERLTECWRDVIEEFKLHNHSLSGILRSARPKSVKNGVVLIEAFYKFHQDKLGEMKNREQMEQILKKLFGEKVKVEIVLGKR
jgi:DNA polymerase III subunit gamma/tau